MFSTGQIILLIIVWLVYKTLSDMMIIVTYGSKVFLGWLVGVVLGDPTTGLVVGGTMELMGMGVNKLGGATVPDYYTGTFVGTAVAIGAGLGLDAAIAIGIPVATLCVELQVVYRMINSYVLHRSMAANERHDFKGMQRWIWVGLLPSTIFNLLPIVLVLTVGSTIIDTLLNVLPAWLLNGFSVAGGVMPAIGFAILLTCLPLKNNFMWVILGYICYSYLGMSALGVALLAFVIAWLVYLSNEKGQQYAVAGGNGGVDDDE